MTDKTTVTDCTKMDNVLNSDYNYVSVICDRETTLSEKPYITWILQKMDGQVISAGCACVT